MKFRKFGLMIVMIVGLAMAAFGQQTHVGLQGSIGFAKDQGYSNPQVGGTVSGALRLDRIVIVTDLTGERAQKNFLDNGTDVNFNVAARVYPLKFVYGEFGYHQSGQYNDKYDVTGHSYTVGGGLSFRDRFIAGAEYLSNDGTVNQAKAARVHGTYFYALTKRIDMKTDVIYKLTRFEDPFNNRGSLRGFTGQGLSIRFGPSFH